MSALQISMEAGKKKADAIATANYILGGKFTAQQQSKTVKYGRNKFVLRIPPKTNLPTSPFSGGNQNIDFELKSAPGLYLIDNDAMHAELRITNSDSVNSVTLNFVESLFDIRSALEYIVN